MSDDELNGIDDEPIDGEFERELALLLADPSVWAEPADDLEDRVVAAVREQVRGQVASNVTSLDAARQRRRSSRWFAPLAAAAVGAAAAAAITVAVVGRDDDSTPVADGTITMAGSDLAPGLSGTADFTTETSGVRIVIRVPGLPRRDGDEFYEGWLKSCDGTELVPIGTFHEVDDAVGWAGIDITTHPILTITKETVTGPKDPAQGSSGEVVVSGAIAPCP